MRRHRKKLLKRKKKSPVTPAVTRGRKQDMVVRIVRIWLLEFCVKVEAK